MGLVNAAASAVCRAKGKFPRSFWRIECPRYGGKAFARLFSFLTDTNALLFLLFPFPIVECQGLGDRISLSKPFFLRVKNGHGAPRRGDTYTTKGSVAFRPPSRV